MSDELSNNDFLGKGWSFPPTFSANTETVEMTEKEEDIQRSLQVLLSTRVGERVMQPKFGCNLDDYLFESLDTTTKTLIREKVETAILYFEPRITVKRVHVDTERELEGVILIEVDYVVRATNSRFNFVFPYFKTEGTELDLITTNHRLAL
jgi:phage baseplate assembly protein W